MNKKYRIKENVFEAIQYSSKNVKEINEMMLKNEVIRGGDYIVTIEGKCIHLRQSKFEECFEEIPPDPMTLTYKEMPILISCQTEYDSDTPINPNQLWTVKVPEGYFNKYKPKPLNEIDWIHAADSLQDNNEFMETVNALKTFDFDGFEYISLSDAQLVAEKIKKISLVSTIIIQISC